MANLNNAPKLVNNKPNTNNFYQLDQQVCDVVFRELGNSSAQIKIMMVLMGTKSGFGVSEAWIEERAAIGHKTYITARKALIDRGWLTLTPTKWIIINYDVILKGNTTTPVENNKNSTGNTTTPYTGNTTTPFEGNMVTPVEGNTTTPIIDNTINNKEDNEINNDGKSFHEMTPKERKEEFMKTW